MVTSFLRLAVFAALCSSASAQLQLVWSHDYDGPQSQGDWGVRAASDSAGNVIVVGRSYNALLPPASTQTHDTITLKYDPAGNLLWDRRSNHYGGNDRAVDVLVAGDGSVYTISYSTGVFFVADIVVRKHDSAGTLVWTRAFDGPSRSLDIPRRACFDAQGNVVVVGYSVGLINRRALALAYDPAGNLLWSRFVSGTAGNYDFFSNVASVADGSIRAVGQANADIDAALFVASFDSAGNVLWQRENNSPAFGAEDLLGIAVTAAGDTVACGYTQEPGGLADAVAIRYDAAGNLQWRRAIGGTWTGPNNADSSFEIALDAAGNAFLAGTVRELPSGVRDMLIAKLDAAGNLVWRRTWDSGAQFEDQAWCIELDSLGRATVGGWSLVQNPLVAIDRNYVLLQYDTNGNLLWAFTHSSPGADDDWLYDLHAAGGGRYVVTGAIHFLNVTPGDVGTLVLLGPPPPTTYCVAKVNSLGCLPAIAWAGYPSASASSGFVVRAVNVRNQKPGLLLYGTTGRASLPFAGGTLCVRSPIHRAVGVSSGGSPLPGSDCTGVYALDVNAFATGALGGNPNPALQFPGTTIDCQWWGRDPGFPPPGNSTLSDGLEYLVEV